MESLPLLRIGNGYDVHVLAEGRDLVLGGVKIDYEKGCLAHSDGDVVLHALCDALLGALALGDIGKHFPDNSAEFKDIDSSILLRKVIEMVSARGYALVNADIVIALQRPKLAPHIESMRQKIAAVVGCETDRISVKATTTEHMGFVGRGEGVESYAVVLLSKI